MLGFFFHFPPFLPLSTEGLFVILIFLTSPWFPPFLLSLFVHRGPGTFYPFLLSFFTVSIPLFHVFFFSYWLHIIISFSSLLWFPPFQSSTFSYVVHIKTPSVGLAQGFTNFVFLILCILQILLLFIILHFDISFIYHRSSFFLCQQFFPLLSIHNE